jgi:hypothetical protein
MLGLPELFNGLAAIRVNVSGLYHEKILFKLWVLKSRIQKKNRRPRSPESPDLLFFPCLALGLRCGGGGGNKCSRRLFGLENGDGMAHCLGTPLPPYPSP